MNKEKIADSSGRGRWSTETEWRGHLLSLGEEIIGLTKPESEQVLDWYGRLARIVEQLSFLETEDVHWAQSPKGVVADIMEKTATARRCMKLDRTEIVDQFETALIEYRDKKGNE